MTFSVITPSRNQLDWLRLCVASVADQGVPVEHIIQDACSNDGTVTWLKQNSGLQWHSEPDGGMYDAINRGLRCAQGEVLSYLNCDEQYLPGTLPQVADLFAADPSLDLLFGHIVMVDERGEYLCHRKVQVPRLFHTWTCHLSTLSCAMFFRRRLIDDGQFFFNAGYRCAGDAEWMVRLLRAGVRMRVLDRFTSLFAVTGGNLGQGAKAEAERLRLRTTAPWWARMGVPVCVAHHRLRRWASGAYRQTPFSFAAFTLQSPCRRQVQIVSRPVARPFVRTKSNKA